MQTRLQRVTPRCGRSEIVKSATWEVRSQGQNSKELTGAHTSGGACGSIRNNAKNLILGLTWLKQEIERRTTGIQSGTITGAAWLSSARAVKCRVKSHVLCVDTCLLYTSDAADDMQCVDLGGRRIIKKKKKKYTKNKVQNIDMLYAQET
eukprot:TRINITY_DN3979_c0_g2_i3.p1 TRINITY_DN3979_c0_g2~~TRINITY_DN3979_c0_g2_i3.p1  ORF type:complete len:150 (+),score=7.67 TRINITY_DN3979_c0_g2_i3:221-670(+)